MARGLDAGERLVGCDAADWSVGQRDADPAVAELCALRAVEGDQRQRRRRGRAFDLGLCGEACEDDKVGVPATGQCPPAMEWLTAAGRGPWM